MPPSSFAILLLVVIAAAGLTVWAVASAGAPFGAVGLVALLAATALRLWRR